jgi:large subunit ribosomal protein L15
MRLNTIKPNAGAKHRRKRLARGESSGLGKTAGRGHKCQKSRSGGGVRVSFEGGQMPIYRRLPKRGFNNAAFTTTYAVVNVSLLEERFEAGASIDEAALRQAGIVKGRYNGIKILGDGEISKSFKIEVNKVSASARDKIEKAGGSVTEIVPRENPAVKGKKAPAAAPKAAAPKAVAEPAPEAAPADPAPEAAPAEPGAEESEEA